MMVNSQSRTYHQYIEKCFKTINLKNSNKSIFYFRTIQTLFISSRTLTSNNIYLYKAELVWSNQRKETQESPCIASLTSMNNRSSSYMAHLHTQSLRDLCGNQGTGIRFNNAQPYPTQMYVNKFS